MNLQKNHLISDGRFAIAAKKTRGKALIWLVCNSFSFSQI